ncbi:MAG: hypothetical protein HY231_21010 [Acidobacteria bacterium]|nr:hypothetical protein [Acidobacteriota bacterium]
MFVGHYSVSFAAKSIEKSIPLWLLFLAVQFIDVLWGILVLLGIEKVRIVPGITASNALDLYFMPYTHSLLGALWWSLVGFAVYKVLRSRGANTRAAALVGVAIFSHWILDFVVHRPDLGLYNDSHKMGLGLWNYPVLAFALEAILLVVGLILYLRSTVAVTKVGKFAISVFTLILLLVQLATLLGPAPATAPAQAVAALSLYFIFAAMVFWLERQRQ